MGYTDKDIFSIIIMSLFFGVCGLSLFGQNERELLLLTAQKYRSNESVLFSDDTNSFIKVNDELFCQTEIVERNQFEISRIQGYERQRSAHQKSFTLTVLDFCRETGFNQHIFMNATSDSSIELGVRCYSGCRTYLGKAEVAESLQGQCLTTCIGYRIGKDSLLTTIYTVPKDVQVAKLYKLGHRCFLLPIDLEMDECGIFILRIPANKESIYAFYNTPNYICLIEQYNLDE